MPFGSIPLPVSVSSLARSNNPRRKAKKPCVDSTALRRVLNMGISPGQDAPDAITMNAGTCPIYPIGAGRCRRPESRRGPFPVPLKGWRAALAAGGGLVPRGGDFRREAPQTRRRTLAGGASEGFGRLRRDLECPLYTNEHVYGTADTRAPYPASSGPRPSPC